MFLIGSGEGGLINDAIVAHIYENQGNNDFILSDELIGGYLSTHAVADINNDNFPDLVLGGTTTGSPVRGSFIYTNVSADNLSVDDTFIEDSISIFPNPSNGTIYVDSISDAVFDVYDMTGKRIFSKQLFVGENTLRLDVSEGIYLTNIRTENRNYVRKLIISN